MNVVAFRIGTALTLLVVCGWLLAQQPSAEHGKHKMAPEVAEIPSPLLPALKLLREGKTLEARALLMERQKSSPEDPEIVHQLARSFLFDFYRETDVTKRRTALALAMEAFASTLKKNPNHIPALRAKAIIHARAELLYYDPNLAYELASRVAKLEPNANAYILSLTEWMSGEVRFNQESEHRVPHDPLLGLDRSIQLLASVVDNAMPFSNEETAGYFAMGKALSRRGNFADSISYFKQTLSRTQDPVQRNEALREIATSYYRMGDYADAARNFYEALQWRANDIDRWLLKAAMDLIPGEKPILPKEALFPSPAPNINPLLNLEFKDIAPELGVNRLDGNGTCAWGDFDGDGDLDIAAIAFYPEFDTARPESFVYLENAGGMTFTAFTMPEAMAGRWMVMDAGDVDGDGDPDVVLGSFVRGPTTVPVPPSLRENWRTNGAAVLLLENMRK